MAIKKRKVIKAYAILRPTSDEIPGVGVVIPGYEPELHDKAVCAISYDLKKLKKLKKCSEKYNGERQTIVEVEISFMLPARHK